MPKYLNKVGKLTPAGQELAAQLYDPAVGTMLTWLADGQAATYSRYGDLSQVVLNTAQADRYLREDIAVETFVRALPPFLRRLDSGAYDAARATTATYFIGACRNRIGDVIRDHHVRVVELRADTDELLTRVQSTTVEEDMAESFELARRLLLDAPHNLRSVLLLLAYEGVTLTEAAKRVGVNPTTIRSQLLRYKKRIAQRHFWGVLEIPAGTSLGDWVRTAQAQDRAVSGASRIKGTASC